MDDDTSPSQPSPPASLDTEVAAFLSAPTPRRDIPPEIESEAYAQISPARQLFLAAVAIACGTFVMLVSAMTPSTMRHDEELSAEHTTADGIVLSAEPARVSVAGSRGPYLNVFRFSFSFGTSGQVGVCYAKEKLWNVGEQVTVEYNPLNTTIARIQGARLASAGDAEVSAWSSNRIILLMIGLLFIGTGIMTARKYFKQRALCRQLLKNGAVDEFVIGDMDTVKVGRYSYTYYVFHLKLANRSDGNHSYFSQFAKENQTDYAKAVRSANTTTFGLYDPTDTADRRQVFMVKSSFQ